jgi:hypothetical protein
LIPLAIVNVLSIGVAMILESEFGWNRWFAALLTSLFTLGIAALLVNLYDKRAAAASSPATAAATDPYAG